MPMDPANDRGWRGMAKSGDGGGSPWGENESQTSTSRSDSQESLEF